MAGSLEPGDDALTGLSLSNRRSLSDDVVDLLRAALVRGTFEPGQHLNEAGLAEKLGVSRGPIREAFVELQREGLLTLERHRGARVNRLSRTDIDEIYELRKALERLAVERAVRQATEDDFAAMSDVVTKLRHPRCSVSRPHLCRRTSFASLPELVESPTPDRNLLAFALDRHHRLPGQSRPRAHRTTRRLTLAIKAQRDTPDRFAYP
jgi:DNA-binding transcriptional regulator YhcF (GntR family)